MQNPVGGLRADLKLRGEDIVVGVIDSGIAPNHPSLLDTEDRDAARVPQRLVASSSLLGLWLCMAFHHSPPIAANVYDPPIGFTGACQAGPGFEPTYCNNKVVGARFYLDGFLAQHKLDPGRGPFAKRRRRPRHAHRDDRRRQLGQRDAARHASRARQRHRAARAHRRLQSVLARSPATTRATCTTSDLVRAIDDAVADGVDLINYSVGSLDTELDEPDDLALLDALDAGVLTVVAAGNDGPELDTIGSRAARRGC